jgi:hypothetical protein
VNLAPHVHAAHAWFCALDGVPVLLCASRILPVERSISALKHASHRIRLRVEYQRVAGIQIAQCQI